MVSKSIHLQSSYVRNIFNFSKLVCYSYNILERLTEPESNPYGLYNDVAYLI